MAGLLDQLKKIAAGTARQVNPFDRGATYNNPYPQPRIPFAPAPQQSFGNKIRDLLDANTQADQYRRVQAGQPAMYREQQIAQGNTRPYQNVGAALFGNAARLANTVAAVPAEAYGTGRAGLAMLTNNQRALENANRFNVLKDETLYRPDAGLVGQGTIYDSPQQKNSASALDAAFRGATTGAGAGLERLTFGAGGAVRGIANPVAKVAARTGIGAAENAIADVLEQQINREHYSPAQTAGSAVFGGLVPNAGAVVKPVARGARNVAGAVGDVVDNRVPLNEAGHVRLPGAENAKRLIGDERGSVPLPGRGPMTEAPTPGRNQIGPLPDNTAPLPKQPTRTQFPDEAKLNTGRLDLDPGRQRLLGDETIEVVDRLSNDEIQEVAKTAGLDTRSYKPEQVRQRIAEQLNVRRDAVRLVNEAEAARASGNTTAAEELIKQAAERGRLSRGQGTELAQGLQARKIIANELDTPQQRLFKLLDEAGVNPDAYSKRLANVDMNDSAQVVKAFREMVPPKAKEWLDVVRYNSMLSSPLTHGVNIASNTLNVGVVAPVEKTLRGIADAAGGLFGKERRYAAGEGAAYAKGAVTNIKRAADNFIDAMRTGENQNLDLDPYSTPLAVGGVKGATYQTLSFPMKMLGASDKFFRTLAEAGETSALNLRESKGIRLGGNKRALAEAEGAYRLYQQDTNLPGQGGILQSIDSVTNAIMRLRKDHTWAKFVFPFVKTPTNILKQGVEFSPLGFANAVGAADKTTALTRAAAGTAVFGAAWAMTGAGDITWSEPTNQDEKNRWRAEGKQPYSMRIGGKWVSFSKLPPGVSFPFALTSALNDARENSKISDDKIDQIMTAVAKYGQFLGDQSYVKNIGDTLGFVKGDKEKMVQAFGNYPQQVVPFRALTGWIARMTDDKERRINTDQGFIDKQVQSLMQNYPGLRQRVPTRDYQGQPIPANNPVLNAFSPFRITDDRGVSPLDRELDLAKATTQKDPTLNPAQQKELDKRVEGAFPRAAQQMIQSQEYKSMSPEDKAKALNAIRNDVRKVERQRFQAEKGIGEYAPGFSGKQTKLTKDQEALTGGFNPGNYKPGAATPKNPADRYKAAQTAYEENKANMTAVERYKAEDNLKRLQVAAPFSEDVTSLYGMSKTKLNAYLASVPNGGALAAQLKAYDDAQVAAGLRDKGKFATGIAPARGGRRASGGRTSGRRAAAPRAPRAASASRPRAVRSSGVRTARVRTPKPFKAPRANPYRKLSNSASINRLLKQSFVKARMPAKKRIKV